VSAQAWQSEVAAKLVGSREAFRVNAGLHVHNQSEPLLQTDGCESVDTARLLVVLTDWRDTVRAFFVVFFEEENAHRLTVDSYAKDVASRSGMSQHENQNR
jgi:hypothetical protein